MTTATATPPTRKPGITGDGHPLKVGGVYYTASWYHNDQLITRVTVEPYRHGDTDEWVTVTDDEGNCRDICVARTGDAKCFFVDRAACRDAAVERYTKRSKAAQREHDLLQQRIFALQRLQL